MPRFPQEILDSIINEVALIDESEDNNMSTLKTCTLASRHFLHCCRKHIFKSVSLLLKPSDSGEDTTINSRLCEIIERTPVIAGYIRTLCLSSRGNHEWGSLEPSTRTTVWSNTRLGNLLDKLPNVDDLYLAALNWDEVLPSIQQAIFKLMCSPQISNVHIMDVQNLPQVFVQGLQGVPRVRVAGVGFLPEQSSDGLYQFPPGFQNRLTQLYIPSVIQIAESDPLVQLVSSTSHQLKILQLDLMMDPSSPKTYVAPIALSKHGSTLKEIVISGIPSKLDLSNMLSLDILTISPRSAYLDDSVSMRLLTEMLATIPAHNRIREIDISIHDIHVMARREGILTSEEFELEAAHKRVHPVVDYNPFGEARGLPAQRLMGTFASFMFPKSRRGASPLPYWKRLDETLAGRTFRKLEKINLALLLSSDELKEILVERLLPKLHSKGDLLNLNC